MTEQLTANACASLNNPTNYVVLVSEPVLRIVDISPAYMHVCDFVVDRTATVTDGAITTTVALPTTLRVWAATTGPQPPTVNANDVIKVQRMLRLPGAQMSVILVHDVEICSGDDMPLEITHYEDKIQGLQAALGRAEAALKRVLQEQHGVSPTFVDSIMQLVVSLNDTIDQAMT